MFLVMKSKISNLCIKKCCKDKHDDLLLIGEEEKKHNAFIKDFNTFMYDHILHILCRKKHFCCYCLQHFRTAEKLKSHIKNCFKIKGKQTIKTSKNDEYFKFNNVGAEIKSLFIIYVDFEAILVSEDNEKQNPNECFTNICQ